MWLQVTQLGHVKDLATAFTACLGNPKASKQIFNIAGARLISSHVQTTHQRLEWRSQQRHVTT